MWIFKKTYSILAMLIVFVLWFSININTPNNEKFLLNTHTKTENNISYSENNFLNIFDVENIIPSVYANDSQTQNNQNKNWFDFNGVVDFLNSTLGVLTILVSPLIMFAGWLMSPDWVTGDIFGLREKMYNLWLTVSNIVYFIYAILLIVIAIATIFNSQNFGYKALLPRLFIGIILVPLSWWFVQFVVSTATMVTATVLEIPADIAKKETNDTWWTRPTIPKQIDVAESIKSWETFNSQCNDQIKTHGSSNGTATDNWPCTSPRSMLSNASGIYSPLLIYGYGIFKIHEVKKINPSSTTDVIENIAQLTNGMIFSALMMLIFGILVIALTFILFVRAIKMWLYAVFSPLFSIKIVFEKQWTGETADTFSIKEFIGLAFVPAVIGLALSFGLLVAATIHNGLSYNSKQWSCNMATEEKWCELMSNIMGNPQNKITQKIIKEWTTGWAPELESGQSQGQITKEKAVSITTVTIGWVDLQFKGSIEKWAPVMVEQGGSFLGAFGTIIIQFVALIFIWMAFMMAAKVNKWVAAIVEPFERFWKSIKDMGQKSIQHVPLPIVGNVHGLGRTMDMIQTRSQQQMEAKFNNSSIGQKFWNVTISAQLRSEISHKLQVLWAKSKTEVGSFGNQFKTMFDSLQWLWMWHAQTKEEFGKIFKQINNISDEKSWDQDHRKSFALSAWLNITDHHVLQWIKKSWKLEASLNGIYDNDSAKKRMSEIFSPSNNEDGKKTGDKGEWEKNKGEQEWKDGNPPSIPTVSQ